MKRIILTALTVLALGAGTATAINHGGGHGDHRSGTPATEEIPTDGHRGMQMGAMLGTQTVAGVKAMAHLNDVRAQMAKAGMTATHHLSVTFATSADKAAITEGRAAVRITGPDGRTTGPVALAGMDGHFGADLTLPASGIYRFMVGTRLADNQTRQFSFDYEVK